MKTDPTLQKQLIALLSEAFLDGYAAEREQLPTDAERQMVMTELQGALQFALDEAEAGLAELETAPENLLPMFSVACGQKPFYFNERVGLPDCDMALFVAQVLYASRLMEMARRTARRLDVIGQADNARKVINDL